MNSTLVSRARPRALLALVLFAVLCVAARPARAQERYDDHELTDRFYITLGGYTQDDLRTTIRIDAKTPGGGIAAGAVIGLESLFDVEDQVTTARVDGWYRFNKRHRISWIYWRTDRNGQATYNENEAIEVGDVVIQPGDNVQTDHKSNLIAVNWTYSFVNTGKYEAWLGTGLNFQTTDVNIDVNVSGGSAQFAEEAKGTVPIPTINFGGRWDFNKRWRMLLMQQLFGLEVGDFSGKLENTRILAEFNITRRFGIGGGFERFNFEVDAESDDFLGELDISYSAFTLYLKGQF